MLEKTGSNALTPRECDTEANHKNHSRNHNNENGPLPQLRINVSGGHVDLRDSGYGSWFELMAEN